MGTAKALLLGLLVAGAARASRADQVAAFHCESPQRAASANVRDVHSAYGWRSVSIIKAALANNTGQLTEMVAPTATFTVFQGDVGTGPRSVGAEGAIDFAKQVAPRGYQFISGSPGPFSMDPCGSAISELTLIGDKPHEAVIATFKYRDGVLTEVQASHVEMVGGTFSKRSPR